MCGNAPATFRFNDHVEQKTNLLHVQVLHGKMQGMYELCPETVDFMIAHLTKMRKQFVKECG